MDSAEVHQDEGDRKEWSYRLPYVLPALRSCSAQLGALHLSL